MFEVSYYAKVGEHGSFTCATRKGLTESGVRLRRDPELLMVEGTQYAETEKGGRTEVFTVIYKMTQPYLNMVSTHRRSAFSDERAASQYIAAATRCLRTGKAVRFKYR